MRIFKREEFSRKQLHKSYSHLPPFVVDFVFDSFYVAAFSVLSWWGKEEFNTLMQEHIDFMRTADRLSACEREEVKEEDLELRDTILHKMTRNNNTTLH